MKKLITLLCVFLMAVSTQLSVFAMTFPDTQTHWGNYWIDIRSESGNIKGYPDGLFKPDNFITSTEADIILTRFGAPDLIEPSDSNITRENSIAYIAQAIEIKGETTPNISDVVLTFNDNTTLDDWSIAYAKQLIKYGTLDGYPDNKVRGKDWITRAEFVKLLYEPVKEEPTPTPEPTPEPEVNKSQPPAIDEIMEYAETITGSGIPGSQILIALPDGSTVTATVASDGTWIANVPSNVSLIIGDIISANQTEPGKTVSEDVYTTVIGNPEVEPSIDVYVENLTTGANYAQAGNVLLYNIIVSNNGTASSTWSSAYATFFLDELIELQENSIRINNSTVTSSQYSYYSAANTLTLYLGDIVGGNSVSISFRVTVNSDISNINQIVLEAEYGQL